MKELFNNYVQNLETYIMFQIKQRVAELKSELEAKGRAPIMLSMGAPVQPPPQFVIDKLKESFSIPQINTYSSPKGESFFLEAVAKRMKNRFGVDLDPSSEIFSLIGSKEGLANFARALCNPSDDPKTKDIILIPDPGYATYKEMVKVSGGLAYPVELSSDNNYMPDFYSVWDELAQKGYDQSRVKALIINYPSNPLGVVCDIEYLKKVVDFCREKRICLISDAAYCDMYFDASNLPHSVLEVEGAKDVAVEFYSFSKPYAMTGWRLGWVCGNAQAVQFFGKLKSTIDTGLFKAVQYAGAQVLNSVQGDEYISSACESFKIKQMILVDGLRTLGWDIPDCKVPSATFYLWLPIPNRYNSSKQFTDDLLEKSGVVAVPGNAFGDSGEGWFRISAVAEDDKLREVIERMKADGFYF